MARHTESFNKADAATLGPDLTWTEVLGSAFGVTGNRATIQGAAGTSDNHARAEADVDTDDMYAEVTVPTHTLPSGVGFRIVVAGLFIRYSAVADTGLVLQANRSNTGNITDLRRWVAGVESASLGTGTGISPGDRLRIQARGTEVLCYVNGVLVISHTEGTILTGKRGGFRSVLVGNAGTGAMQMDDFEVGDLGHGLLLGRDRNRLVRV